MEELVNLVITLAAGIFKVTGELITALINCVPDSSPPAASNSAVHHKSHGGGYKKIIIIKKK